MAAAEKRDSFRKYILLFWAIIIAPILFLAILITAVSLGWMGKLPTFEQLENPKNNLATEVYSSDMQVLGKYYVENRSDVKFKQLSPNLVHALVATEDARFYEHSGVDIRGLFRVMFKTILGGKESSGGGSTLTQQLAKMLFPREDHSSKIHLVIRKIKEWVIATRLERQYTKDEILSMYLNKFDFMNNAVGIKSAANIYFDTSPDKLSLGEAAMLVGMEKNPSLFNPIRRPKATKERRDVVLSQMFKYKYISKLQMDSTATTALELKFHPENHNEGLATYFREYLRDNFLRKWCDEHRKTDGTKYDIYKDGLKIYTTIDSRMQRYAEEAVEKNCKDLQAKFFEECKHKRNSPFDYRVSKEQIKNIMTDAMRRSDRYRSLKEAGMPQDSIILIFNTPIPMTVFSWHGDIDTTLSPMDSIRYSKCFQQAGFMSMDPQTGYIKAWVGGINHKYFKYDHVKEGKRQVGSTFKSFVYALAIQEGYSPCYEVPNVPVTVHYDGKDWSPINADNDDDGKMMTLKEALAKSVNRIAAFLIKQFGPQAVVDLAKRMGITSEMDAVPSICLGTPEISVYDMVGAYSTFANKGTWTEPIFVTRIEDKNGRVLQNFAPKTQEVMSEEKAYIMLDLLKGVVQYGTGVRIRYKYKLMNPIAGKTGTTQNNSDGWFMGITPDLVSGCWVGWEDRSVHFSSMQWGQGASEALPIWAYYMQSVYADKSLTISQGDFAKPAKKLSVELDCAKYEKQHRNNPNNFDANDPQ